MRPPTWRCTWPWCSTGTGCPAPLPPRRDHDLHPVEGPGRPVHRHVPVPPAVRPAAQLHHRGGPPAQAFAVVIVRVGTVEVGDAHLRAGGDRVEVGAGHALSRYGRATVPSARNF